MCSTVRNCADNWDGWGAYLPLLPREPQELELLGSIKMDSCLYFNHTGKKQSVAQNVNSSLSLYRNSTAWCNYASPNISRSTDVPLALPSGIFFTCGDHTWGGMPSHVRGRPCGLGRLTLLTPNTSTILNYHRHTKPLTRAFQMDCGDDVGFWSSKETILASICTRSSGIKSFSRTE